jgi:hypothetical protein
MPILTATRSPAAVTAAWSDLAGRGDRAGHPSSDVARVRDLWTHTDLGTFPGSFTATLPPHGARLLRVRFECWR